MLMEVSICRGTEYGEGFELREAVLLNIPQGKSPDHDLTCVYELAISAQNKGYITAEASFAMYDWVRAITDAIETFMSNRYKDDDFVDAENVGYRHYKDRTARIKCLYKRVIKSCQDFWAALNGEGQYKLISESIKAEIFEHLARIQYWVLQEAVIQRHLCYDVSLVSQKRPAKCRFHSEWRNATDDDFWILDDFTLVTKNPEEKILKLDTFFEEWMDKIDCDPKTFGTFRR